MNLLQYTSKEMFSSTELIRKSKTVFDKLNKNEIEKAVILRDGKPSFMLLDFEKYENLITEYMKLQEEVEKLKKRKNKPEVETKNNNEAVKTDSEINNEELEAALEKIEKLDLNIQTSTQQTEEKEKEPLKDFWE